MSATVFAAARYGVVDDDTATGLHVANITYAAEANEAMALNHGGSTVGYSIYDDKTNVDFDGVVAVKATGFALDIADVVTLANTTADSLNLLSGNLFTTSVGNAGLIVKSTNITRTNTGFEEGSASGVYFPLIATNSPTTLAD